MSIEIDPRWRTATVLEICKAIKEEKDPDRFPILGDALMEAGCDTSEIIEHCHVLHVKERVEECTLLKALLG